MKYLKHYTSILTMLMLLTLLSFTSCGGDDDGGDNGPFFNVTVSSTEGGVAHVSNSTVIEGETVKLTVLPDKGYKFLCWTVNGVIVSTENPYTTVVIGNYNYVANFVSSEIDDDGLNNGHEYVDLGLSVKWATCNIGADSPENYGDYFAWGETSVKSQYDGWENYKLCNWKSTNAYTGTFSLTKYCTNSEYGTVDNKTVLELEDDAARFNWGGSWRIPTREEQKELVDNCIWEWTTQNGVKGYKVTSKKNDNYIFLPASGYRNNEKRGFYIEEYHRVGSCGLYWSSLLDTRILEERVDRGYEAYILYFTESSYSYYGTEERCIGLPIRPVCK